jgi:hypothetical protein
MGIKVDVATEQRDLPDGVESSSGFRFKLKQNDADVLSQDTNANSFTFEGTFSGAYVVSVQALDQAGNPFGDEITQDFTYQDSGTTPGQPVGKYDAPSSITVSQV